MTEREGIKSLMNIDEDKSNKLVRLVSTKPINYSWRTVRRIEEGLTNGGYEKVHHVKVPTPGIAAVWIIGNHKGNDGIYSVSVDISDEKRDDGFVYVRALGDQIENVKGVLRVALPKTEFKPLPEPV